MQPVVAYLISVQLGEEDDQLYTEAAVDPAGKPCGSGYMWAHKAR